MLRTFDLGPETFVYIRSQLGQGRGLGRALLQLPIESGRAFTYLPEGVSPGELRDFESGGVASGEENRQLAEFVHAYVGAEPNGVRLAVFEHPTASRGDARKPQSPYFTVGDDVYLFVEPGSSVDDIARTAREAHWYPSLGVLGALPSLPLPRAQGSEQSPTLIATVADGADHVLVGAYDAEAWIIWSRD